MNLADIRKKNRERKLSCQVVAEPAAVAMPVSVPTMLQEAVHVAPPDVLQPPDGDACQAVAAAFEQDAAVPVSRKIRHDDPLGLILAGRRLAEQARPGEADTESQPDAGMSGAFEEYLCVRVDGEYYGINIMQIKEIIRPREVTELPQAPDFLNGIISLRGIVVPVISLATRLGLPLSAGGEDERVVVIKNRDGYAGLLVEEVIQVVRISLDSMEMAPAVLEGIDRDFVRGIGRNDQRMLILLNLEYVADLNLC